jgi:hypothetical protein
MVADVEPTVILGQTIHRRDGDRWSDARAPQLFHVPCWSTSLYFSGQVRDHAAQISKALGQPVECKAMPTCNQTSRSLAGMAESAD